MAMAEETKIASRDDVIKIMANAAYDEQVRQAKRHIDKLEFHVDDMEVLFPRLVDESETAQVLIFFSYLDDRMKAIINANLVHVESNAAQERLFGMYGPLSTFNTRTLIAFHLGWLSPELKEQLDALRRIRNAFGHRAFKVSFEDQEIISQWARIDNGVRRYVEYVVPRMGDFPAYSFDELPKHRARLCEFAMLARRTFEELIILPVAQSFKVDPTHIAKNFDDQPELFGRLGRAFGEAMLHCLQREGSEVPPHFRPSESD